MQTQSRGDLRSHKTDRHKTGRKKPYHHGALQDALIAATDEILQERGIEGFTLREAARRAGVSPAAPLHHFGSAAGLLTEIATRGFEDLARHLREARIAGGEDATSQLRAEGLGYVRFAVCYPGRFKLMFRKDLLLDDQRLHAAASAAYAELDRAVRAYLGADPAKPLNEAGRATLLGAWSVVHGFAHLVLEGRLDLVAADADLAQTVERVLPGVLAVLYPSRR